MMLSRKPDTAYFDADTYWGKESKRLHDALRADPTNRQLQHRLKSAEKMREQAYEKARAEWEREQDAEYAAQ